MDEDLLFDAMPTILAYLWAIAAGVSVAFQVGGVRSLAFEFHNLRPLRSGHIYDYSMLQPLGCLRDRFAHLSLVMVFPKQRYGTMGVLHSEQREFVTVLARRTEQNFPRDAAPAVVRCISCAPLLSILCSTRSLWQRCQSQIHSKFQYMGHFLAIEKLNESIGFCIPPVHLYEEKH